MATASKVETVEVTLTLSADEAQTLAEILGSVGGSPHRSARRHASAVLGSLRSVGFTFSELGQALLVGSIQFLDEED